MVKKQTVNVLQEAVALLRSNLPFATSLGSCGLGLRREFLRELLAVSSSPVSFLEIAPENWLGIGGKRAQLLREYTERYPLVCHGLSLSLGSIAPLNIDFIKQLRNFFDMHAVVLYSEHLSYSSDEMGGLYDLMPIPFTEEAVRYVAARIKTVQDILERPIAIENISYYAHPTGDLTEVEFINAVIEESRCLLLLDVNNIYVNSVNHHYDPLHFLQRIHQDRIAYLHIAGHWEKSPGLIIDTHGDQVADPVWELLAATYREVGLKPTLLERDNQVPDLAELFEELAKVRAIQASCQQESVC